MNIKEIIDIIEPNPFGVDIQVLKFNHNFLENSNKVIFIISDNSEEIVHMLSNIACEELNFIRGLGTEFESREILKTNLDQIQNIYNHSNIEYSSVSCLYYTDDLNFIAIVDSDNYAVISTTKEILMSLMSLDDIFLYYSNLYSDYHYNKYKIWLIDRYSQFFFTKNITSNDFKILL